MKRLLFVIIGLSFVYNLFGQWTQLSTGFTNPSTGVRYLHVVDEEIVWFTAYDGSNATALSTSYCKTLNGGISWENSEVAGYSGYGTSMIFALNGSIAWMPVFSSSGGGAILKTVDGGNSWTEQSTASFTAPSGFPNMVYFWDANVGFCAGDPNNGYFEIYTTNNGGQDWIRVPQINIPDPITIDEYGVTGYFSVVGDTVWYSTNKGRIYKSVDKGNNWNVLETPVGTTQFKIVFKNSSNGLIYNNQSNPVKLYETFDGGDSWSEIFANGPLFNVDLCFVPGTDNTWVSTGNNLGVSYSYDGGYNWEYFQNTSGMNFLSVSFISPEIGWAGDFTTDPFTGGINKYTGNIQPLVNDVGIISIDIPELIEPGAIVPKVTFKNFGSLEQSFDVSFTISGVYTSFVPINNLAPFQTIQVSFDQWQASIGLYTITVNTLLTSDTNSSNDFLDLGVEVLDLTVAYCYVAYDPSGDLPMGPGKMYLEAPSYIFSIDNQVGSNFVSAGSWGPQDKWYGAVYYDDQTLTGGELININSITGERTIIGAMGEQTIHGLSYDFNAGIMFATTYDGISSSFLHSVNLNDGSLTLIGETNSDILINLACDSSGDLYAVEIANDFFGKLDKETGDFDPLFSIGFNAAYAQDMEFNRYTDSCYMTAFNQTTGKGEFYSVDISNQTLNYICQFPNGAEITGFAIPYSVDGNPVDSFQYNIRIYPNPGTDRLILKSDIIIKSVRLFDNSGKLNISVFVNNFSKEIDVSRLGSGTYTLEIMCSDNKYITKKFVKIR